MRRSGATVRQGRNMDSDFSALFYVLVAVILLVKFYAGSCGCD
jgi:hypothetical protein